MRVRGLGYGIGAGLGALGLIGIFLWVSTVSARLGSQVEMPDQAADNAAEDATEPSGDRSKDDEQQAAPQPAGPDIALNRLESRPVTGPEPDRDHAADEAKARADGASAVTETDGTGQPQSRILRVETDGAETGLDRSADTPTDNTNGTEDGAEDPGTSTSTTEHSAPGPTVESDRGRTGGRTDKRGPVHETDDSTTGRSARGSKSKPEPGTERQATSTTAPTTAEPSTASIARETTTTKAPTTSTTADTTRKAPTTTVSGGGDRAMEQRVIELTNDARRQAGCPAVVNHAKLRQAAYLHSKDMSDNDYFNHTGLDGSSPWDRISRQGYRYLNAAENIAWGHRTPEAVVEVWMSSSGHRANILNCNLTEIGVGFYDYYWTQKFAIPH